MAVVYERAIWRTSHPKPKKTKKRNHPKKTLKFFKFLKKVSFLKLPSSSIKKILIFSQKKAFLVFFQKKTVLIFPGTELPSSSKETLVNPLKILIFQQTETLKKLLIFQEVTYKTRKNKKKFAVRKFLVSYDVLVIFTLVEHMEISFEAKIKVLLCLHYELFNYLCYTIK